MNNVTTLYITHIFLNLFIYMKLAERTKLKRLY